MHLYVGLMNEQTKKEHSNSLNMTFLQIQDIFLDL